jgi:hypothetical protein
MTMAKRNWTVKAWTTVGVTAVLLAAAAQSTAIANPCTPLRPVEPIVEIANATTDVIIQQGPPFTPVGGAPNRLGERLKVTCSNPNGCILNVQANASKASVICTKVDGEFLLPPYDDSVGYKSGVALQSGMLTAGQHLIETDAFSSYQNIRIAQWEVIYTLYH